MSETALYLQSETSAFMMSIVLITSKGNAVVIDGGRPEDLPKLREIVAGSHVSAWILTHPHLDHITAFSFLIARGKDPMMPDKVYYHFPPLSFMEQNEPQEAWTLRSFLSVENRIKDRAVTVRDGDVFDVDELTFTILQAYEEDDPITAARPGDQNSAGNENSLVFRIDSPGKSVLILGDTGPLGGDRLMSRHWRDLKCDIVQMAHHGHGGVGAEVYLAAQPKACLWCCPAPVYDEEPIYIRERLWGTAMTRKWMELIGVREHYVTKDGTQKIML